MEHEKVGPIFSSSIIVSAKIRLNWLWFTLTSRIHLIPSSWWNWSILCEQSSLVIMLAQFRQNNNNNFEMNVWPSQWIAILGLQRDSNPSPLRSRCSALPAWAMKTHTLETGQFIEFINPWKEWNTEWNDVNCGNTHEMNVWPSQWIAI